MTAIWARVVWMFLGVICACERALFVSVVIGAGFLRCGLLERGVHLWVRYFLVAL